MMFGLMSFSLSGLIGMMAYITHVFTGRATTRPVVLHEIACTKCGHMNPTDSELCTRCGYYLDRARN